MNLSRLDDTSRLSELENFNVVYGYGERDGRFERICRTVCNIFHTPLAAFVLVDHQKSWTKAAYGMEMCEFPRECSFGALIVESNECLNIPDVARDLGACAFPQVAEGGIRAVLGAPLRVGGGLPLGALLVADRRPRTFSSHDMKLIQLVADIGMDQMMLHRVTMNYERRAEISRKQAEKLKSQQTVLKRKDRMFDQVSRMARVGGWELDVRSSQVLWSDQVYRIHELPSTVRPTLDDAMQYYPGKARDLVTDVVNKAVEQAEPFEFEVPFITAAGNERWVKSIGDVERDGDQVVRLIGTFQDVTEQKTRERYIEHIATHDDLTGLPNRKLFQHRMKAAIERAGQNGQCLGLMLVDVDHFKSINDTLGHETGDAVLKSFAAKLTSCVRQEDTVARIGGDEFAIVLPDLKRPALAGEVAERIHRSVCSGIHHDGEDVMTSASMGIAVYPGDGCNQKELLKKADIALYEAKNAGRSRFAFFDPGMEILLSERHRVLNAISQAISERQIFPYYQALVRASDHKLEGFEALVRWRKPDGQVVPPGFFQAALDDKDLSCEIGHLMAVSAIKQMAEWSRAGLDYGVVSLNISSDQIRTEGFAETLLDLLEQNQIPPGSLCVEITEGVLLSKDRAKIAAALVLLSENGVQIDLDDFGTGYASLTHLREFRVDRIKIDRSFISVLPDDAESLAIVRAIISLAKNLNKHVVAEGVETADQARLLHELGCDSLQGYLFSKPIATEAIPDLITGWGEEELWVKTA